jgi:hypothetical protein
MDPVTGGGISILNLFKEGSSETERYIQYSRYRNSGGLGLEPKNIKGS